MRSLRPAVVGLALVMLAGAAGVSAHAQPRARRTEAKPPEHRLLPEYRRVTLDNGATLLLLRHPEVPLVAMSAVLRGGSVADPAGKEGLTALTAELLRKGAGERSAAEIAALVDGLGASLSATADRDATGVYLELMSRDLDTGVALLADVLQRPKFPEEEVNKTQALQTDAIKTAKEDPRYVMGRYFASFLFGDHPYGRPTSGTEETVPRIEAADVRAYHEAQYGGDRLILAAAGDIDLDAMEQRLREAFGGWRKAGAALPEVPDPERTKGRRVLLVDKPDATQTYFYIGNVGVSRTYERRVALDLIRTLFGGRFTSMLNQALRIESGLTYGARNVIEQPLKAGENAIWTYTETSKTKEAIELALEVLATLQSGGIDAGAMRSGKAYIRGQMPLGMETAGQLASHIAELELYGLGPDEINDYFLRLDAISREDTATVVSEVYPRQDDLVFVLVGNAAAIRETAAALGPVTERKISAPGF